MDVLLFPDLLHNIHNITPHAGQTPTDRTTAWRTLVVMAATYVGSGLAAVLAVGNSLVANASHVEAEPPQHNDGQGARATLRTEDARRVCQHGWAADIAASAIEPHTSVSVFVSLSQAYRAV